MSNAKAKTINLLLYEGNLNGVICIEDTSWNSGELYSAPRESAKELLQTDACNKYGVYLLLSKNKVYVGQASDLSRRITQHLSGKDWWTNVVILTTKTDSLDHTDIDYLESNLIQKASMIGRLDCENKNRGNNPKADKFRKVFLDQYLEEALFLMQLIGITVFAEKPSKSLINTIDIPTKLAIGKRAKKEAIQYVKNNNIQIGKKVTYAIKKEDNEEFWANPNLNLLQNEWWIILNNNTIQELVILKIPANTFHIKNQTDEGLLVRSDEPEKLNLHIHATSFIERISGMNFKPFIVNRLKY